MLPTKLSFFLYLSCCITGVLYANEPDKDAQQLNQRCAPCHGSYGQGTSGANAPRLAGLPAWYLEKATRDYLKNARKNPLMVEVSGLRQMTDQQITRLSQWLSEQNIGEDPAYDIKMTQGDEQAGQNKFNADCKSCHGRSGYGKKKKDAPPLAGQYPAYLMASIKAFFHKERYHDNDPIDDTFDDISDSQARNILAWIAKLDDKKQLKNKMFKPRLSSNYFNSQTVFQISSVQQSILSMHAKKGLTLSQVTDAILKKAAEIGTPTLPDKPDSLETATVVNFKFCEPRHIKQLLSTVPLIASYDPCRITVVKTANDISLMTINLEMLIDGMQLPLDTQHTALVINQDMLAIMNAVANFQ